MSELQKYVDKLTALIKRYKSELNISSKEEKIQHLQTIISRLQVEISNANQYEKESIFREALLASIEERYGKEIDNSEQFLEDIVNPPREIETVLMETAPLPDIKPISNTSDVSAEAVFVGDENTIAMYKEDKTSIKYIAKYIGSILREKKFTNTDVMNVIMQALMTGDPTKGAPDTPENQICHSFKLSIIDKDDDDSVRVEFVKNLEVMPDQVYFKYMDVIMDFGGAAAPMRDNLLIFTARNLCSPNTSIYMNKFIQNIQNNGHILIRKMFQCNYDYTNPTYARKTKGFDYKTIDLINNINEPNCAQFVAQTLCIACDMKLPDKTEVGAFTLRDGTIINMTLADEISKEINNKVITHKDLKLVAKIIEKLDSVFIKVFANNLLLKPSDQSYVILISQFLILGPENNKIISEKLTKEVKEVLGTRGAYTFKELCNDKTFEGIIRSGFGDPAFSKEISDNSAVNEDYAELMAAALCLNHIRAVPIYVAYAIYNGNDIHKLANSSYFVNMVTAICSDTDTLKPFIANVEVNRPLIAAALCTGKVLGINKGAVSLTSNQCYLILNDIETNNMTNACDGNGEAKVGIPAINKVDDAINLFMTNMPNGNDFYNNVIAKALQYSLDPTISQNPIDNFVFALCAKYINDYTNADIKEILDEVNRDATKAGNFIASTSDKGKGYARMACMGLALDEKNIAAAIAGLKADIIGLTDDKKFLHIMSLINKVEGREAKKFIDVDDKYVTIFTAALTTTTDLSEICSCLFDDATDDLSAFSAESYFQKIVKLIEVIPSLSDRFKLNMNKPTYRPIIAASLCANDPSPGIAKILPDGRNIYDLTEGDFAETIAYITQNTAERMLGHPGPEYQFLIACALCFRKPSGIAHKLATKPNLYKEADYKAIIDLINTEEKSVSVFTSFTSIKDYNILVSHALAVDTLPKEIAKHYFIKLTTDVKLFKQIVTISLDNTYAMYNDSIEIINDAKLILGGAALTNDIDYLYAVNDDEKFNNKLQIIENKIALAGINYVSNTCSLADLADRCSVIMKLMNDTGGDFRKAILEHYGTGDDHYRMLMAIAMLQGLEDFTTELEAYIHDKIRAGGIKDLISEPNFVKILEMISADDKAAKKLLSFLSGALKPNIQNFLSAAFCIDSTNNITSAFYGLKSNKIEQLIVDPDFKAVITNIENDDATTITGFVGKSAIPEFCPILSAVLLSNNTDAAPGTVVTYPSIDAKIVSDPTTLGAVISNMNTWCNAADATHTTLIVNMWNTIQSADIGSFNIGIKSLLYNALDLNPKFNPLKPVGFVAPAPAAGVVVGGSYDDEYSPMIDYSAIGGGALVLGGSCMSGFKGLFMIVIILLTIALLALIYDASSTKKINKMDVVVESSMRSCNA